MSRLIEEALFLDFKQQKIEQNKQNKGIILKNNQHLKFLKDGIIKQCNLRNQNQIQTKNQSYTIIQKVIHKFQDFTLVVLKKLIDQRKYKFQGKILRRQQIFKVNYKQKRILFGKEWVKNKVETHIKMSLSFQTGQIKIVWPQILYKDSPLFINDFKIFKRIQNNIYNQLIGFFESQLVPLIRKIILCDQKFNIISREQNSIYKSVQSSKEDYEDIGKIQKYLHMCTIIDTFSKDKQTYKKLQDKFMKQKQNIVRIQTNIDLNFSNIGNELLLYTLNNKKIQRQKLVKYGMIQTEERKLMQNICSGSSTKSNFQSQQQFLLNIIGILQIQNRKRFISSGGMADIFVLKIRFQYIFSDDPKFWIQSNKKTSNNIVQKSVVIKEAKVGYQQKLNHQNHIIKQMKSGYSIYLPRYYKIQSMQTKIIYLKNENMVIMDYIKGETLEKYQYINWQTLSFWSKIFIIRNILNGLKFLSDYKIVHLDLKPINVIVTSDLLTKIFDFGQSYHPVVCDQKYKPGVSFPYSCPQVFRTNPINYNEKCDVFSLGMIMFEMFFGQRPFQLNKQQIKQIYIKQNYLQKIYLAPQKYQQINTPSIINIVMCLIMKCLNPNPDYRPTINWLSIIINHFLFYFRGK